MSYVLLKWYVIHAIYDMQHPSMLWTYLSLSPAPLNMDSQVFKRIQTAHSPSWSGGAPPRPYGYPQTRSCQISFLLPVQKSQQNPMAVLSHTQIYILIINYFSEIKNLP